MLTWDRDFVPNANNSFLFKSCFLWQNVEKYGTAGQRTDDNTLRCMRFVCWITKARDTRVFSTWQYLGERASMLRFYVDSSWNVMAHGDAREGKWRGNWWMEWLASTLHTSSEHSVSSITTADAHTSAASSRLNGRHCRFKWTRPFRRKKKSGFCGCAVTFETQCALLVLKTL